MTRIEKLESDIRALYDAKNPQRDEWADWLAKDHVFIVADYSEHLSERFGANREYSKAAAMLHDIADAVMSRFDEKHEEESLSIARELLQKNGFDEQEIQLIIDDAVKYHSCRNGKVPQSLEGKVLATADSLAHLKSDFYAIAKTIKQKNHTPKQISEWALKKLERDYYNKIQFDEIRVEVKSDYERLKDQFTI